MPLLNTPPIAVEEGENEDRDESKKRHSTTDKEDKKLSSKE